MRFEFLNRNLKLPFNTQQFTLFGICAGKRHSGSRSVLSKSDDSDPTPSLSSRPEVFLETPRRYNHRSIWGSDKEPSQQQTLSIYPATGCGVPQLIRRFLWQRSVQPCAKLWPGELTGSREILNGAGRHDSRNSGLETRPLHHIPVPACQVAPCP